MTDPQRNLSLELTALPKSPWSMKDLSGFVSLSQWPKVGSRFHHTVYSPVLYVTVQLKPRNVVLVGQNDFSPLISLVKWSFWREKSRKCDVWISIDMIWKHTGKVLAVSSSWVTGSDKQKYLTQWILVIRILINGLICDTYLGDIKEATSLQCHKTLNVFKFLFISTFL